MHWNKLKGLTLVEMVIVTAVIVILATITVLQLKDNTGREDLLMIKSGFLANLNIVQNKSLTAKNVKICDANSLVALCEDNTNLCDSGASCDSFIPNAYGVHLDKNTTSYIEFVDINPPTLDFQYSGIEELLKTDYFLPLTHKDQKTGVSVENIQAYNSSGDLIDYDHVDITFIRQSGEMRFRNIGSPEPNLLFVVLKHVKSGRIIKFEFNRITGRISAIL